jgi:hypothetical protein
VRYRVKVELWVTKDGELTTDVAEAAVYPTMLAAGESSEAKVPEEYRGNLVVENAD